jgi:endonuclease YncB( thermonuclease family)
LVSEIRSRRVCPWRLEGGLVKITDGDTLYVLDANYQQHKIRLAGIDAPERKQAYGLASRST